MEGTRRRLAGSGASSLVLGILTLIFGLVVGILGIINGGRLLSASKKFE